VSYSGSTEETLATVEEVHQRGGRAIMVSSGGPLAALSSEYGYAHIVIPSGLQPRASLGYLTLPILGALVEMGLIPDLEDDVTESVKVLADLQRRCRRENSRQENPAKDLAARILDRIPVVYGGEPLGSVAAYRFKCDLNEYGKSPAFWNELPELDHNEIVGWNKVTDVTKERFVLVLLRDTEEHERVALRFDITRRLIERNLAEVVEVYSEGTSQLARLLSLILVTQLASIYVGLAYEVDPGPVEVIMKLKAELAAK
jgi:glucose/mannose-6-phosphate isomerase